MKFVDRVRENIERVNYRRHNYLAGHNFQICFRELIVDFDLRDSRPTGVLGSEASWGVLRIAVKSEPVQTK